MKIWNIEEMTGYKPKTTFYQDFSIADMFGADAIKDTYKRAFNEWKNNIQYLTELVMVLNWKIWEYYDPYNKTYVELYDSLWEQAYHQNEIDWDDFCYEFGNFIGNSHNGFLLCGTVGTWRGSMLGGCYVDKFDDLYKFWSGCDYIKVYDENGHIYIEASHHDGTNYAELKEVTDSGIKYMSNHYYDCDEITYQKMFKSNFYTRLPHYCRKVWGTKDWDMKGT